MPVKFPCLLRLRRSLLLNERCICTPLVVRQQNSYYVFTTIDGGFCASSEENSHRACTNGYLTSTATARRSRAAVICRILSFSLIFGKLFSRIIRLPERRKTRHFTAFWTERLHWSGYYLYAMAPRSRPRYNALQNGAFAGISCRGYMFWLPKNYVWRKIKYGCCNRKGYIDTYAGIQEDNGFPERNHIRYIVWRLFIWWAKSKHLG